MQVFKFGGASVKDAAAVKNVAEVLKKHANKHTVVVISAMGKTTNGLENLVNAYFKKTGNAEAELQKIKDYHYQIISELFPLKSHPVYNEIENTFVELNWIIEDEPVGSYNQEYERLKYAALNHKNIPVYENPACGTKPKPVAPTLPATSSIPEVLPPVE